MNEPSTLPRQRVDTRDMEVVHTALLREIRLGPAAVRRAAADGTARARTAVARHLTLLVDLLEHHHATEDELLHPLLRARVPRASLPLVEAGEEQHAGIESLLADTRTGLQRWTGGDADADDAAGGLAASLADLHAALEPHLRAEERDVLPLAAEHMTAAEWGAIGEAGFAATPKPALLLVFGMFALEGDPAVLREMLAPAPAPARFLVPRLAPRVYARRARRVHGTGRP